MVPYSSSTTTPSFLLLLATGSPSRRPLLGRATTLDNESSPPSPPTHTTHTRVYLVPVRLCRTRFCKHSLTHPCRSHSYPGRGDPPGVCAPTSPSASLLFVCVESCGVLMLAFPMRVLTVTAALERPTTTAGGPGGRGREGVRRPWSMLLLAGCLRCLGPPLPSQPHPSPRGTTRLRSSSPSLSPLPSRLASPLLLFLVSPSPASLVSSPAALSGPLSSPRALYIHPPTPLRTSPPIGLLP